MDMPSIRRPFLLGLSCAVALALGCSDDADLGSPSGGTDTDGGATTSDGPTTTSPPPPPTTGEDTTPGTTEEPTDSSPETDGGDDDTSSDTTGETASGTCQQGCSEPADCCPDIGASGCPEEGPNEWTCTDEGLCEKIGCTEDVHCADILPPPVGMDLRCRQVDGVGECVLPCADDVNCSSLTGDETCSGIADDNSTYCAEGEEEEEGDTDGDEGCRAHADCGGLGLCDVESGECYCTESVDCTDATYDTCVVR
jgi:hypothetical protein